MVYDTTRNLTWIADANLFKTQYDQDNSLVDRIIATRPVLSVGSMQYPGTILIGSSNYGHGGSYVIDLDGRWHRFMSPGDYTPSSGMMNWWGAKAWADQLSYGGYDDWRLPTLDFCGVAWSCAGGELGGLLTELRGATGAGPVQGRTADAALFSNIRTATYWSDSGEWEYAAFAISADSLTPASLSKYQPYGHAWAVRDGDVGAVVPEPSSSALLGLGAAALALLGRVRKRQTKSRRSVIHPIWKFMS